MNLIVGLGNPGREYGNNRHNVGFMCLNYFAKKHGIPFDRKQAKARIGVGKVAGKEVVLAKPQTFMNSSGQSVSLLLKKFNIPLDDLVVIHDDLDLPLGKIRIRPGGSAGGHKGIQSIIDAIGSQDFARIKIGIGRPVNDSTEDEIIDYVLSTFTADEKKVIAEAIPRVSEAIFCLLTEGIEAAMGKFN